MKILGITGNSGSGKTLISKLLKDEYDANLIDADKIAKEISKQGMKYFNEIVKEFGKDVLLENGEINRAKLAEIIFADDKKRERLNKLTFKYVVEKIKEIVNLNGSKMQIIDAPLLIESGLNEICDIVISVIADEEVKVKRICKRDNIDEKIAKSRIKSQPKDDFYIKNSNYVIVNNNDSNIENHIKNIKEIVESQMIKSKETVIIQDEDVKLIKFKALLEYNNILTHAFTLKPLDFGSNDTYKKIKSKADSNYKSVCELLKLDSKNIIRPYQTHTNNIKEVNKEIRNF